MLLTITYTAKNSSYIGYLLHKNPSRAQSFELNFGKAYVFYPEVSDERTTVALLLDIDPIDLAKGKAGSGAGGLFDYVSDRPYVSSSFMSTAIGRVFGTAMKGRCDERPLLATSTLDLTACIRNLACRGDLGFINEVFEPLGYEVSYESRKLDERFPEWGESPYIDLTIKGNVRLCDLLNHIYVLIPVFDRQKHYFAHTDEIEKLLRHGEGWLADHPERNRIVYRYFNKKRSFANTVIRAYELDEEDSENEELDENEEERRIPLNEMRLNAVKDAIISSGANSVIDIGCGEGRLISRLLAEPQLSRVSGADASVASLQRANENLNTDRMPEAKRKKLQLFQGSLTYRDDRFSGYDCISLVEVIEHLDLCRLSAFERVVFEFASPKTVIITTPNKEYNANYEWLDSTSLRHFDHRFEWSRAEFREWCMSVCKRFGYTVKYSEIGEITEKYGAPTQMGVFTKCE